MHILIAVQNKNLADAFSFALESQLKAQVTRKSTAGDAIELLVRGEKFGLLILEHPALSEPILRLISALKLPFPVVLAVGDAQNIVLPTPAQLTDVRFLGQVQGNAMVENLIAVAKNLSQMDDGLSQVAASTETEIIQEEEFCRISPRLLVGMEPLRADIYLRLGPQKYVRLVNAGDKFETADRQKYLIEKQIEYLYVKKGDAQAILNHFKESIEKASVRVEGDPSAAARTSAAIHETTLDLIARVGVTTEVSNLIKSNILLTVKSVGNNPRLKSILSRIVADRKKFISAHSTSLAQLSCAIGTAVEWGSASTFQKLTMASFLHDCMVTNNELAMLQTRAEIQANADKYSSTEIREYYLHPAKGAQIVQQFAEVPPDVDTIIVQHHERPDGSGFPRGLTRTQIAPLSALFIVAHELISLIFAREGKIDIDEFLELKKDEYSSGNFRKVFNAIKEVKLI